MNKIKSILELAKHKVGDVLYWVALRPIQTPMVEEDDAWVEEEHPKTIFERGYMKKAWSGKTALPKMHAIDFDKIAYVLTSKLKVEEFIVTGVMRSHNTGEFIYFNTERDWLPESSLFVSSHGAKLELLRISKMMEKWGKYGSVR